MKLYRYSYTSYPKFKITIEKIEVKECDKTYTAKWFRLKKEDLDFLNGYEIMYSLSKDNIDYFKLELIKRRQQRISNYYDSISYLQDQIATIAAFSEEATND